MCISFFFFKFWMVWGYLFLQDWNGLDLFQLISMGNICLTYEFFLNTSKVTERIKLVSQGTTVLCAGQSPQGGSNKMLEDLPWLLIHCFL